MKFWDKIVYCANYLLNRILTKVVGQVTPVEKWCGKKAYVGHLKIFGCVSWVHFSDDCRKKMDAKIHTCIMMGYPEESKAYRLFDLVKK
jgi:hypothetical protein